MSSWYDIGQIRVGVLFSTTWLAAIWNFNVILYLILIGAEPSE